jgi:hypothetical protein
MTDGTQDGTVIETKRGRVRHALVEGLGFRFPRGTPEEVGRKRLDRICDDLAYLSDEGLRRLVGVLRTKGEGSAKAFWPERATFLGFAEAVEPRQLEEAPGVASWFASAAGKEALLGDRLVAEFRWWERAKRPPLKDGEKLTVEEWAREYRERYRRCRSARDAGLRDPIGEEGFIEWYEGLLARALALVEAGKRGEAA